MKTDILKEKIRELEDELLDLKDKLMLEQAAESSLKLAAFGEKELLIRWDDSGHVELGGVLVENESHLESIIKGLEEAKGEIYHG